MKFDKNEVRVSEGQKITLTLNHTGKMSKEIMGHNFVLLKKETDLNNMDIKTLSRGYTQHIAEALQQFQNCPTYLILFIFIL